MQRVAVAALCQQKLHVIAAGQRDRDFRGSCFTEQRLPGLQSEIQPRRFPGSKQKGFPVDMLKVRKLNGYVIGTRSHVRPLRK